MKKKATALILAMVTCFHFLFPLPASAAEAGAGAEEAEKSDDIVYTVDGKTISVGLTLPDAAGEKVSSLQLTLTLENYTGKKPVFTFSDAVTASAKVTVCRLGTGSEEEKAEYSGETVTLKIYIAGTTPLYTGDTLNIGSLYLDGFGKVAFQLGDVAIVRGSRLVELDYLSKRGEANLDSGQTPKPDPTPTPMPDPTPTPTPNPSGPGSGGYNPGSGSSSGSSASGGSNTAEKPDKPDEKEDKPATVTVKKPKLKETKNAASGVTITWKKAANADGYYVYRKTPDGKWKRIAVLKGKDRVSYTDKSVKNKNGKIYSYTVKAYNKKDKSSYDIAGLTICRLTAPALSSPVSRAKKQMTVAWKKNAKASGYQIQYATSSDFDKGKKSVTVKSAKTVSKNISGLKTGKTYYVRVRSYKKVDGKNSYSAWSKVRKVKVK